MAAKSRNHTRYILGKPYKVKYLAIPEEEEEGATGLTKADALCILIDTNIPRENQDETLLHEILEALDAEMDLGMDHNLLVRLSVGLYSAGVRAVRVTHKRSE